MKTLEVVVLTLMFLYCIGNDQSVESKTDRKNFAEFISPNDTDSQIDVINRNFHYVMFNEVENGRSELMVFLGGTMSRTSGTSVFSAFAANRGFHVINLAYPNRVPVSRCSNKADMDCALKYRKEIFSGVDDSDLVDVDVNNSIENRLQKLLRYLIDADPKGSWQQFLKDDKILWNKIVVAGHSQGAGHAAFIGTQKNVKRVLMFSGPNDFSRFYDAPANWLSLPGQTPLENYYAFLHLRDETLGFDVQKQCLRALGFDIMFNVDENSGPFGMNNVFFTNKKPDNQRRFRFGAPFHGSVVNDRFTPFVNGQPVHSNVWKYMLGVN